MKSVLVLLLQTSLAFANGPVCLAPHMSDIDRSIQELAALRLSIDLKISAGETGPQTTTLVSDFRKRERAVVDYVQGVMSAAELRARILDKILEIQREGLSDREQRLTKAEEEKLRQERENQLRDLSLDGVKAIF